MIFKSPINRAVPHMPLLLMVHLLCIILKVLCPISFHFDTPAELGGCILKHMSLSFSCCHAFNSCQTPWGFSERREVFVSALETFHVSLAVMAVFPEILPQTPFDTWQYSRGSTWTGIKSIRWGTWSSPQDADGKGHNIISFFSLPSCLLLPRYHWLLWLYADL